MKTQEEKVVRAAPTPWRNPSGSVSVFANWNEKICDMTWSNRSTKEAEANAAFIVRACNSHQGLLDASKAMLEMYVRMVNSGSNQRLMVGNIKPEPFFL